MCVLAPKSWNKQALKGFEFPHLNYQIINNKKNKKTENNFREKNFNKKKIPSVVFKTI